MTQRALPGLLGLGLACLISVPLSRTHAADAPLPKTIDYNRDIRPIFSDNCYACHGPDKNKRKAELQLNTRDGLFSKHGKVVLIVPGKPEQSELYRRLTTPAKDERMPEPKSGKRLSERQIALVKKWIEQGAEWKGHWAFLQPVRPELPPGDDAFVRNAVDRFVVSRLHEADLRPSPEADRVTLIRRLSFDLTGLPPTKAEVDAFVNDKDLEAYEKLVDHLLSSPAYGERMAMSWLDLVRYADSIGYHSDNPMNVSPYRDYVIRAFNSNKRFDQFTIEQLAGDLLPNATVDQKVASAYNRLLQTTEEGGAQAKEYEAKYAADRVRNVSSVWLGATMGCCQCHDHKFDPFTTRDFYSMAAFFADVQEAAVGHREAGMPVPNERQEAELKKLDAALVPLRAMLAMSAVPQPGPTGWQRQLAVWRALAPVQAEMAGLVKSREELLKQIPMVLVTNAGPPRVVRVLPRGNWLDESGPVVQPATPAFLVSLDINDRRPTRLDLAHWVLARDNPLTARVFVNRLWKLYFGQGLSKSLEDFGAQGEWPTHPELLDWLAVEFVDSGWDVKHMVKLLVLSSTYRQSSAVTAELKERDPYNRLLARQGRFRLDAEMVRDNALAISGLLAREVGGSSVKPYQPPGYWAALNFPAREWQNDKGDGLYRRGLYTHWQRSFLHPSLLAFDAPSREECIVDRPRSNIPQQALVLLNDPTYVEASRAFAERIVNEGGGTVEERVTWAFGCALSRKPKPAEVKVLVDLHAKHQKDYTADRDAARKLLSVGDHPMPKDADVAEMAAWTSVARVILNLHEAITRN